MVFSKNRRPRSIVGEEVAWELEILVLFSWYWLHCLGQLASLSRRVVSLPAHGVNNNFLPFGKSLWEDQIEQEAAGHPTRGSVHVQGVTWVLRWRTSASHVRPQTASQAEWEMKQEVVTGLSDAKRMCEVATLAVRRMRNGKSNDPIWTAFSPTGKFTKPWDKVSLARIYMPELVPHLPWCHWRRVGLEEDGLLHTPP